VKAASEEQLRRLFELSLDLLLIVAPDGRVIAANPSWERVLGHPPAELEGHSMMGFVHPDDVEPTLEHAERMRRGEPAEFENRYRHADGHYVRLFWSTVRTASDGTIYTAARDITAERRAMEAARAAVRRMEEAQRVARVGSWEVDLRTGERHYTPEMYAIQGMDPAVDHPWDRRELLARVLPEHRERVIRGLDLLYDHVGPVEVEFQLLRPHGRWLRSTAEAVRDAHGNPILIRGTTQDVTALRENERRLGEAERLADLGSFEWRASDGEIVWSEGVYRVFGRDVAAPPVRREELLELLLPEDAERLGAVLDSLAAGEQRSGVLEVSIPAPSGPGRRVLQLRGESYRAGEETYLRGTVQDVTRLRRAERQQQEIARLGQLALAGSDLRQLFDEVVRVVRDVLSTDVATILAIQGDGSFSFAANDGTDDTSGTAIAPGQDSIARRTLAHDGPEVVGDWLQETRFPYSPKLRAMGVRSTAVVPIRGREGPFGVLTTHARQPGIATGDETCTFLEALATFLSTAIDRLRHEAEIAALATLRGRLVAENLEAEERVRQRISEQLHDGALQDLLAARQDLVEAASAREDHARTEMLDYAREGVERAVRRLREAVHALHPVVLQHGGLEAAMQAAADQAARQGSFRAEVTVDPAAAGVRDELVLSIARELLANAAKHAEADHVQVTVARQDGVVLLEVTDDGRGLDREAVAAAPMHGHIGLASLAQRVEAVGGTLDLGAGAAGRGTTALARLPID
jgi:PAS domain S-box-containing protein